MSFLATLIASTGGDYHAAHIPGVPQAPPIGRRGKGGVAKHKRMAVKRRNQQRARRCA